MWVKRTTKKTLWIKKIRADNIPKITNNDNMMNILRSIGHYGIFTIMRQTKRLTQDALVNSIPDNESVCA